RSAEMEAKLKEQGYKSRIHRRGARNHPLPERQQAANTTRSRVRARVEHVFADQENGMGGIFVRTIGMARAAVKIGMMNLVYNMRRFVGLGGRAAPGGVAPRGGVCVEWRKCPPPHRGEQKMGRQRPHSDTTECITRSDGAENSQIHVFFEVP